MTPAARIKTIKRIGDLMGSWEWADIDLTLGQFGLPTSDRWQGNGQRQYVIDMIEATNDAALQELLGYLANDEEEDFQTQERLPWSSGYFRLFGSHLTADRDLMGQLKRQLGLWAVDLFVAHQDIKPTKEWVRELELALATCDGLMALLSPDFHASPWTDQEVGFAVSRRVLVVPVCVGVMPYGFMSRYQGLKADKMTPEQLAEAIFTALAQNSTTSGRIAEAVTSYVADADSFARANRGSDLFSYIDTWSPALLRRLEDSIESNTQVKGAFKVPDRIRRLVAKHGRK